MHLLIDATAARRRGALIDYTGIVPAIARARREDERVTVAASEGLSRRLEGVAGLEVVEMEVAEGFGRGRWLYIGLPKLVRQLEPDVLLGGQFTPPARVDVPYILRLTEYMLVDQSWTGHPEHPSISGRLKLALKRRLFRRSANNAIGVLVATKALADVASQQVPALKERGFQAPLGPSPVAEASTYRPEREWKGHLLTMHASPHKNIELILEALARPELGNCTLSVMADLDQPKTKYQRSLRERMRSLGVEERVRSLGSQEPQEVTELLNRHDVLIIPSLAETWSHGVFEGFAAGIPVVASDIPVHREVGGGGAWLVGTGDVDGLVNIVEKIARGESVVDKRKRIGYRRFQNLNWSTYALKILEAARSAV